jgi:hypothetical protein
MSSTPKSVEVDSDLVGSQQDSIFVDQEKNTTDPAVEQETDDESGYISGIRLGLIVLGLCMAVLLVGLVILSSQIPWKYY